MSSGSVVSRFVDWFTNRRSIGFGFEYLGVATLRYPRVMSVIVLLFTILCF